MRNSDWIGCLLLLALLSACSLQTLPLAGGGTSTGGTDVGGAIEQPDRQTGSAWFLGEAKVIHACIDASEGADRDWFSGAISRAFQRWAQYLADKKVYGWLPPQHRLSTTVAVSRRCAGHEALVFHFGVTPPSISPYLRRGGEVFGLAQRIAYDPTTGASRGFIWVAPMDWRSSHLEVVLLHEIGHVLGVDHVAGTIMDAQLAERLSHGDESNDRLFQIDRERELVTGWDARYAAPFPRDAWFAAEFRRLTGHSPLDGENSQIVLRRSLTGWSWDSLVFEESHGSLESEYLLNAPLGDSTFLLFSKAVFKTVVAEAFNAYYSMGSLRRWAISGGSGTAVIEIRDSLTPVAGTPVTLRFALGPETSPPIPLASRRKPRPTVQ